MKFLFKVNDDNRVLETNLMFYNTEFFDFAQAMNDACKSYCEVLNHIINDKPIDQKKMDLFVLHLQNFNDQIQEMNLAPFEKESIKD